MPLNKSSSKTKEYVTTNKDKNGRTQTKHKKTCFNKCRENGVWATNPSAHQELRHPPPDGERTVASSTIPRGAKTGDGSRRRTLSDAEAEIENSKSKYEGVAPYHSPTDRSMREQNQQNTKNPERYGKFPTETLTIPGIPPYQYEKGAIGDKEPRTTDNNGHQKGKR